MTEIVLQHGGQRALNMQNNQGETPLHLAARAHDTATADLLLRAAQKAGTETAMLALRDARGHTAAEWAALVWSPVLQTICQHSPTHCQPTRPFKENTESLTVDKDYRRGFDDFAPGADDWRVESTREPSLELSANNEQQRCGIDRRTALSPEEFEQQYVNQARKWQANVNTICQPAPASTNWRWRICTRLRDPSAVEPAQSHHEVRKFRHPGRYVAVRTQS
jgi:hypothetical protein